MSRDGGTAPAWREDGRELVYVDARRFLMSVSVDATPSFQAGAPRELFKTPTGATGMASAKDLTRFLIPVPVERKAPQGFTVVLNWASALKP